MTKKALGILCVFSILLTSFASCSGGSSPEPAQTSGGTVTEATTTEPETTAITCDAPQQDYKGYEFRIMGEAPMADRNYDDLFADEDTGDAVNDAVHARNRATEEYFNIKFARLVESSPQSKFSASVLASDDSFDASSIIMTNMAGNVKSGYALELHKMKYLDIDKPWWTTSVIESMEVAGKTFGLVGDPLTRDKDSTWCLVFNKRMLKDFGIAEPYDMIREGKWTMDVLQQHCQNVTKDINGDGTLDWHDQWGLLSSDTAVLGAVTSCDIMTVEREKDGKITFNLNSPANVDKMQRLYEFMADTKMQLRAQAIKGVSNIWTAIKSVFQEGRALYRISIIKDVVDLRDMEDDFGVIPMPKYSEDQKEYYTMYQAFNCRTLFVPITVSDVDRTGAILEYFAYSSRDTVREAYYDVTLSGKVSRDKDSTEMLDIIFNSLKSDIGMMYELGGIRNMIIDIMKEGNGQIASTIASKLESINTAITETETAIEAIK